MNQIKITFQPAHYKPLNLETPVAALLGPLPLWELFTLSFHKLYYLLINLALLSSSLSGLPLHSPKWCDQEPQVREEKESLHQRTEGSSGRSYVSPVVLFRCPFPFSFTFCNESFNETFGILKSLGGFCLPVKTSVPFHLIWEWLSTTLFK